MSRLDTAIRAAAGITVVWLAGIAGAISYSHMAELAEAHGEHSWRAHMFPLSVDGIEIVASLVLLADKRAGRRSGYLPWAALITGTAASFAANVAVGGSDWIGRAVSGWPAFAFLIAVKLLFGLLDHPAGRLVTETPAGPVLIPVADRPESIETVPTEPVGASLSRDEPGTVPDDADDGADDNDRRPPVVSTALDVSALIPAARAARAALTRSGRPLTREALARQMRADGHSASNARVSALLKVLAAERAEATSGGAANAA